MIKMKEKRRIPGHKADPACMCCYWYHLQLVPGVGMIANCKHEKVDVRSEFDVNESQCPYYSVEDPTKKADLTPEQIKRQEAEKKREQLHEQATQIVQSGKIDLNSIKDPQLLTLIKAELAKQLDR